MLLLAALLLISTQRKMFNSEIVIYLRFFLLRKMVLLKKCTPHSVCNFRFRYIILRDPAHVLQITPAPELSIFY